MNSFLTRSGRRPHARATAAVLASAVFVSLPAVASGAIRPKNDDYDYAWSFNAAGTPLYQFSTYQNRTDTSDATLQSNIFSPCGLRSCPVGPAEPDTCYGVSYGNTLWYAFYPDQDGQVEIRTAGFPNVIALYTVDPETQVPTLRQCEPGSDYDSNELFNSVYQGEHYAFQVGGRGGAAGALQVTMNYATSGHLTVAPFVTQYFEPAIEPPGVYRLVELKFIDLSPGETVSYDCTFCQQATQPTPAHRGNVGITVFGSPPAIGAGDRLLVTATAPAEYGRYKLYTLQPGALHKTLIGAGCLKPDVTVASGLRSTTLPPGAEVSCPEAPLISAPNAEYVFWKRADGVLSENWYDGSSWSRAIPVGDADIDSPPAVIVHPDGEQDVFWQGSDSRLCEAWWTGGWNSTCDLGSGRLGSGPAAVLDSSGGEEVFWRGLDGYLWEMSYSHGKWTAPAWFPELGKLGSAPAVTVRPDGEQDVFWRGTAGELKEAWSNEADHWHQPISLGTGRIGSAPTAGTDASGNVFVFWKGTRGGLYEQTESSGGWGSSIPVNNATLDSPPTVIVHPDGEKDVFWQGPDGKLMETWFTDQWSTAVRVGVGQLSTASGAGPGAAGAQ